MNPDFKTITLAAQLSNAAYEIHESDLRTAVEALGCDYIARVCSEACCMYLARHVASHALWLVFQGTRVTKNGNPREWLDDMDVGLLDIGFGLKVTKGPWNALKNLWPDIRAELLKLDCTGGISVTGHSLGGWFATLALDLIAADLYPIAQWITFGAPAVGNDAFLKQLPPGWRVTNAGDIAPTWPEEIEAVAQPMPELWLHDGTWSLTDHRGLFNFSIADHSIDQAYLPALARLAA